MTMNFTAESPGAELSDAKFSSAAFASAAPALLQMVRMCCLVAGLLIISLAVVTHTWSLDLLTLFSWLKQAFGPLFIMIFSALLALGVISIAQLSRSRSAEVWFEVGSQAASGIATLALTFTLLGISLGIESLSQQVLTPENIGSVIQDLTKHFSTAFMTTVVGLPASHTIRSILSVRWVVVNSAARSTPINKMRNG